MTKPKINPDMSRFQLIMEILAAICLITMLFHLIVEWNNLPQKVPSHFGMDGTPTTWKSKNSLLFLSMTGLIIYAGLTLLNRFPHFFNYPVNIDESNAIRQYRLAKSLLSFLKFSCVGTFLYIQFFSIQTAFGSVVGLGLHFLFIVIVGFTIPVVVYFMLAFREK